MLVPDPDLPVGERVKILDFGIAKIAESLSATPMQTRSDMLMGTPTYMAPEQCRGAKSVTERSDVYSLAVILYQMLAGHPPFVGDSVGELIAMHLMDPPPPLQDVVAGLEPGVGELVSRMLAKKPEQRLAMEGVFQELQRLELRLQKATVAQASELSPVLTVVNGSVPRVEPQTALLQKVSQLAVATQRRPTVTPQLALPPLPELSAVPTAVRPVIRQPGPGMRTVSVAASESVQPGVPRSHNVRRGAVTLGVLGGVVCGTLALLKLAEPDAPPAVALRIPKRDAAHAAVVAPRSLVAVESPEVALPVAANSAPTLEADTPNPAPEERTPEGRLAAAVTAYKAELYDKAIRAAEPLVKGFPLEARWVIGMAACKQQNLALADRIVRELGALERADAEPSQAEIKLACQSQRDVRKLNLRNPFEPSSTAEQYYKVKLYKQARSAAEQTLKQEPVKSWELIGRASCALKEPAKASEALGQLETNSTAPTASLEALKVTCDNFGFAVHNGRFKRK